MAILNSIRKRGIFLIIIIALALFAFILSGVLTKGGRGQKGQDTVATINGTNIPRQEFMEQVETTQRSLGPNAPSSQAMNMVWDRELRKTLFEEQIEKLGLTVEKSQISNAIRASLATNPTFQNEAGEFDEAKLQEYIATIKTSSPQLYQQWLDFEKNTATTVLQNTYLTMIKGGLRSTLAEGERAYKAENDKINIQYVQVPYSSIPDEEIKVTDEEIKTYIKNHPKKFEVQPQADIQYVFIPEDASKEDEDEAKTTITSLLNNSIQFNKDTQTNDTILGLKNAINNEEFVNSNSEIPYQDRYLFKKDLPPSVGDSIFALNKGDIFGPYKIDKTFNLTKIVDTKQLPDSAQAKHILISWEGLNTAGETTRTKEEAKTLADSILNVVSKDKSKFDAIAAQFSADASNKDKGGDLGYFGPGRMVPAFNDFVFDNNTGKIGIVETQFGYHVVSIEDQKNTQRAIKVATVTKAIEPSEKSANEVFSKASSFEVAVQKGKFDEVAKVQGLELKPVNRIGQMDSNIPGVGNNRGIVSWAFKKETDVGDTKRFNTPEGYVIAQLTRRNQKGLMSVAEASPQVKPILINEKKAEKIRESLKGNTLEEIASSNKNVTIKTANDLTMEKPNMGAAGNEPAVVGAAFGKKVGETTTLIDGRTGVYKVKIIAIEEAPKLQNYASFANQLSIKSSNTVNTNVYTALKDAADIEDHRADFY